MNKLQIRSFKIDNIIPHKEISDGQIFLFLYVSEINNESNQFVFKNIYNKGYFYINKIDLKVTESISKDQIYQMLFNYFNKTNNKEKKINSFCPLCGSLLSLKNNNGNMISQCVNLNCIDIKNYRYAIYDKLKIINPQLNDSTIDVIINCLNDINFSSNKIQFDISQLIRKIKVESELNYVINPEIKFGYLEFLKSIHDLTVFQFFKLVGIKNGCEDLIFDFCNILDNNFYKFSDMIDYFINDTNNNIINNEIKNYIKLVLYNNKNIIIFLKKFIENQI